MHRLSGMDEPEAPVGRAPVVRGSGLASDLLGAQSFEVRLESLVVGGEIEHASGQERGERRLDERAMIALHVEGRST